MSTLLLIRIKMAITAYFISNLQKIDLAAEEFIDLDPWLNEKKDLSILSAIISLMSTISLLKYFSNMNALTKCYTMMLTRFLEASFATAFILYVFVCLSALIWCSAALGHFESQTQYFFVIFEFFKLTLGLKIKKN